MTIAPSLPSTTPADVLAIYAEPLVVGRRVALVGACEPSLVDRLLELGARILYVYDPRPGVVPSRSDEGRVNVLPLRAGDLGVRDGAFDLALVPDLAHLGDREAALAHIRRLVGLEGTALVASRNSEGERPWMPTPASPPPPSYTAFYEACTLQFAEVRMVGAAPFAGYAVAEFAPEREPAIAFDASLVESPESTEWFIAVCSQEGTSALEPYEVVQIPTEVVRSVGPSAESAKADADARALHAATEQKLREAEARAGDQFVRAERLNTDLRTLGEEARKLRERTTKVQKELDDEREARGRADAALAGLRRGPDPVALQSRVAELETELIEARTQLATPRTSGDELLKLHQERERLGAEVASLRERSTQAERQVGPLRAEVEAAQRRLFDRERELEASLARAAKLEDRLEEQLVKSTAQADAAALLAALEERTRLAEAIIERAQGEIAAASATHEADVAALESALRARGEELRAARVELQHRERLVRELVAHIEEAEAAVPTTPQAPVAAGPTVDSAEIGRLREQVELARRELTMLVDEVRRRDAALSEARAVVEGAKVELSTEREKTERLMRDAARREAALQTASWRISELERLGTDGGDDAAAVADIVVAAPTAQAALEAKLEVDALRQALAQEHARVVALAQQVEGGDTLIAQLRAELAARSSAHSS